MYIFSQTLLQKLTIFNYIRQTMLDFLDGKTVISHCAVRKHNNEIQLLKHILLQTSFMNVREKYNIQHLTYKNRHNKS